MKTIRAVNVNEAYWRGVQMLIHEARPQDSRNGPTIEMAEPVSVMYELPKERVLFNAVRDSNPFLGFFEALWIIAGRNDVEFLSDIVANMANYSDNGRTFYGSYGARLRRPHPSRDTVVAFDQIAKAIDRLKKNPDDRRVVLTIRDSADLWYDGADTPCNLMVDCKVRDGQLHVQVFNRSNDFIWGLTGTNIVQFSTLQEYMAGKIGVNVGHYHQITSSMHAYLNPQWDKIVEDHKKGIPVDPYELHLVQPYDMFHNDVDVWDDDLKEFFAIWDKDPDQLADFKPKTEYFKNVVMPMWNTFKAWDAYKKNRTVETFHTTVDAKNAIKASDWRTAVTQWLNRRERNG